MLKNKETGFLEKELGSLNINKNDEYIVNLFVLKEDDGKKLHLRISTDRDVEDWEYGAIFDNYNYDSYGDNVIEIDEIDNDYNPVWEIVIDYDDNLSVVGAQIALRNILVISFFQVKLNFLQSSPVFVHFS